LTIVKPSRLTVGSVENSEENVFINHSIQLKQKDCVYIFSDGYADQFGGNDNKKFKTSRLRELLISVNKHPMEEQKNIIYQTFKIWQNKCEQVDDILVMGIRI
ncbi:MAG: SpoIIE family protein phosphatase, partial [Bacteroidetes bacterium]|nr:SpoIIE family protein phosphatase [Bacteroidota bacterium]